MSNGKATLTSFAKEIKHILASLQLACLAVVPYLIFIALLTVFQSLPVDYSTTGIKKLLEISPQVMAFFLALAYSYQLSVKVDINRSVGMICSITVAVYYHLLSNDLTKSNSLGIVSVIAAPTFCIYALKIITSITEKYKNKNNQHSVWVRLIEPHQLIIPFFLTIAAAIVVFGTIAESIQLLNKALQEQLNVLPDITHMFVRMLVSNVIWAFGLHGDNLFGTMFSTDILFKEMTSNLNYLKFYDLFVLYGGCGASLSLWLALLFGAKDPYAKKIGLLATPFVIFNIPEIMIFGLPVILNKTLLKPFFIVPCVNFFIGYIAVNSGAITFYNSNIPWTTPAIINGIIATDGNFFAFGTQLACIVIGTLIYLPFVRRYTMSKSMRHHMDRLKNKLNIASHIEAQTLGKYQADQASVIKTHADVDKTIALLEKNSLEVYLQPKIQILDHPIISEKFNQFEALLRIKYPDGVVKGPFFLSTLESAGLAGAIDLWVSHEVKRILLNWEKTSVKPRIAINLHPDTIKDSQLIDQIAAILENESIDFEIIERGETISDNTIGNLMKLKKSGFRIALDDFGAGNATLGVLSKLPLDIVKFDKSMLDACTDQKGLIIYQLAVEMCKKLNLESVTEGVETSQQLDLIKHVGINYAQGYLICRPAPVSAFHFSSSTHV